MWFLSNGDLFITEFSVGEREILSLFLFLAASLYIAKVLSSIFYNIEINDYYTLKNMKFRSMSSNVTSLPVMLTVLWINLFK